MQLQGHIFNDKDAIFKETTRNSMICYIACESQGRISVLISTEQTIKSNLKYQFYQKKKTNLSQ